ncbi:hypothetical protein [Pelodictyon luteolum]|uniref:hypothetical protein n=1 Tax=Pelodictyon luteolum TaxID=1100 RepID=UPI00067498AE|nr:hypothetical protein [Pelodictyon luteolum]
MNLAHFVMRARCSGHLKEESLSEQGFRDLLRRRINGLDVSAAVSDVSRFVPDAAALKIWSPGIFQRSGRKDAYHTTMKLLYQGDLEFPRTKRQQPVRCSPAPSSSSAFRRRACSGYLRYKDTGSSG